MIRFVLLFVLCAVLPAFGETYADLKAGLTAGLPPGQKVYKVVQKLTADQAGTVNSRWGGGFQAGDDFTWYYTKDASGKVTGQAVEMTEVLDKYSAYHRWVLGFKPDGTLTALTVLELTNDHTYPMGKASFQKQFAGKDPAKAKLGAGIDAVTGATESCQLLAESLQRAAWLRTQVTFP